jgi:hypothetical protein
MVNDPAPRALCRETGAWNVHPGFPATLPARDPQRRQRQAQALRPECTGPGDAAGLTWPAGPRGTINLTMPFAAWLGLSDTPGQAAGHGALSAHTCRELAANMARWPTGRWSLTLTNPDGAAIAHATSREGPGDLSPPGRVAGSASQGAADCANSDCASSPPRTGPSSRSNQPDCATGPDARSLPPGALKWLRSLSLYDLGSGACRHRRESSGYRPSKSG